MNKQTKKQNYPNPFVSNSETTFAFFRRDEKYSCLGSDTQDHFMSSPRYFRFFSPVFPFAGFYQTLLLGSVFGETLKRETWLHMSGIGRFGLKKKCKNIKNSQT